MKGQSEWGHSVPLAPRHKERLSMPESSAYSNHFATLASHSSQTYNVLTATIQPYIQKGLISDSRVLDIRGVDVRREFCFPAARSPRRLSRRCITAQLTTTSPLVCGTSAPHPLSTLTHLQIQAVKVLENDVNVFIVSFRTQEIINFRDPKTGEVVVGDENKIEQCGYVAVMTRIEEELDNEETGGWKIIDVSGNEGWTDGRRIWYHHPRVEKERNVARADHSFPVHQYLPPPFPLVCLPLQMGRRSQAAFL